MVAITKLLISLSLVPSVFDQISTLVTKWKMIILSRKMECSKSCKSFQIKRFQLHHLSNRKHRLISASISDFEFLNSVKMHNRYAAHMWRIPESLIRHNLWTISYDSLLMRHRGLIRSIFTDGTSNLLDNHPINSYLCRLFSRWSNVGPILLGQNRS